MTTGIYVLKFEGTPKVYIGQSVDIERRFTAHKRAMRLNLAALKLQEAYNLYGHPSLEILVETAVSCLNEEETKAIRKLNSIENGFNTIEGGTYTTTQVGEQASNAQYSNSQYIRVLKLLASNTFSAQEISLETGVSSSVIASIRKCENHKWLKEICPKEYDILLERQAKYKHTINNTAEARGILYPALLSPSGEEHLVKSLRGFAREQGLQPSNLERLLNGHGFSLHGWTVKGRNVPTYPKVVSPEGVEYIIPYGKASEFSRQHGLNAAKLSELLNKKVKSHRRWTIKKE